MISVAGAGIDMDEAAGRGVLQACGQADTSARGEYDAAGPDPPVAKPTLRILVADDSAANRLLMMLILEGVGVVVTVHDGREALDALEVGEFDLFISDVQMPVMDGLEAIHQIRVREQVGDLSRLPIILATADTSLSLSRAQAIGADAILSKPLTAEGVLEAVMLRLEDQVCHKTR